MTVASVVAVVVVVAAVVAVVVDSDGDSDRTGTCEWVDCCFNAGFIVVVSYQAASCPCCNLNLGGGYSVKQQ